MQLPGSAPKVLTQLAWGLAPASYFKNSSGISNMQPRLRTMELEETEIGGSQVTGEF